MGIFPTKIGAYSLPGLKDTLEMPTSPNEALARDIIPAQTGNTSGCTSADSPEEVAALERCVYGNCAGGSFRSAPARSQLFSYIVLIPFVSAYLLYVRRHQLPKNHVVDLPIASVCLAAGLSVLAFTYWSDFAGRAPTDNDRLALLTLSFLCCLAAAAFFFFRASLDASSRFRRCSRNGFEICLG